MVYDLVPKEPTKSDAGKSPVVLDSNDADPNASTVFGLPSINEPTAPPITRQIPDTVDRLIKESRAKPTRPQGTGSEYVRNNDRAKRVRKFGAPKDNIAQAQMRAERLWRIAIAGTIAITATLGGILVHGLAPTVQRMNANDYKPMDGILTGYQGKPVIATLDKNGKLYFAWISGYDSKSENGEILVTYKLENAIPTEQIIETFAKRMPDLENQFMTRPLGATTPESLKRHKIFFLLRQNVLEWKSQHSNPQSRPTEKPIGRIQLIDPNPIFIAQIRQSQNLI